MSVVASAFGTIEVDVRTGFVPNVNAAIAEANVTGLTRHDIGSPSPEMAYAAEQAALVAWIAWRASAAIFPDDNKTAVLFKSGVPHARKAMRAVLSRFAVPGMSIYVRLQYVGDAEFAVHPAAPKEHE